MVMVVVVVYQQTEHLYICCNLSHADTSSIGRGPGKLRALANNGRLITVTLKLECQRKPDPTNANVHLLLVPPRNPRADSEGFS